MHMNQLVHLAVPFLGRLIDLIIKTGTQTGRTLRHRSVFRLFLTGVRAAQHPNFDKLPVPNVLNFLDLGVGVNIYGRVIC